MILRPTGQALLKAALRAALMVIPGGVLLYAASASGVIVPGVLGALLFFLGLLIFGNPALSHLQFASGVLAGKSLLDRRVIQVDKITKIVPVNLTYRRTLLMPWKRSARMFEVCTEEGPTGLWLNPNLYGEEPIERLIQAIGIEPESRPEERILDAFSTNRKYGTGRSRR